MAFNGSDGFVTSRLPLNRKAEARARQSFAKPTGLRRRLRMHSRRQEVRWRPARGCDERERDGSHAKRSCVTSFGVKVWKKRAPPKALAAFSPPKTTLCPSRPRWKRVLSDRGACKVAFQVIRGGWIGAESSEHPGQRRGKGEQERHSRGGGSWAWASYQNPARAETIEPFLASSSALTLSYPWAQLSSRKKLDQGFTHRISHQTGEAIMAIDVEAKDPIRAAVQTPSGRPWPAPEQGDAASARCGS